MIIPNLPSRDGKIVKKIEISLNNEILSEYEFQKIVFNPSYEIDISYEGSSNELNILLQQLAQIRHNSIKLRINKCTINPYICLPFDLLNDKTTIDFEDSAKAGSGFNEYLMNCNEVIFNMVINRLDYETKNRIILEKKYRDIILCEIYKFLESKNKDINKMTNKQKMDFFFWVINNNFDYDYSITKPDGSWNPDKSTQLGGTAKIVYERKKGICEGRSKLLKIVTNNNEIKLPCYIVDGKFGKDGHVWNEYIDDNGTIIEYDLSFNRICSLDHMEKNLPIYHNIIHEEPVEKILKIN